MSDNAHPEEPYLRAAEAAALLHVSPQTVSRWASQGRLRHVVTLGGHRRFPQSEIRRLASALAQGEGPAEAQNGQAAVRFG
jgi:excisionase family DNA binding protein